MRRACGEDGARDGATRPLPGDHGERADGQARREAESRPLADADGNAAYEAHMTKADGTPVTVYVDERFQVVGDETR